MNVTVLHVPSREEDPVAVEVDRDDLKALCRLLNGGYMEMSKIAGTSYAVFCDEEGLRKGLRPNAIIKGNLFIGPIFLAKINPPNIGSLTPEEIKELEKIIE